MLKENDNKNVVTLDGLTVQFDDIVALSKTNSVCNVSSSSINNVANNRKLFEDIVASNIPIYGVTTGYGEMVYVLVENDKETELQTNLVRSHCAAVGPIFTEEESRAILSLRINALIRGYSAVRPELIERMVFYLNEGIIPVIPQIGSLGASGDLGPLSHIAITLIGEGYVFKNGRKVKTQEVLAERGIVPLELKFKEGLSLINGTSAMTGVGVLVVNGGFKQVKQAEIISAFVLETQKASNSPFLPEGHDVARPHQGQIDCARNIRILTCDSNLMISHEALRMEAVKQKGASSDIYSTDIYLQKAYTLRCIPQVLGSVRDSLYHAKSTLEIEINSSNDNPLFFEGKEIFHGGNFHGQPIATVLDLTAIALTQLGIMSERRINRLLNRYLSNGLPEFLVKSSPGLNCGFAGAQYPATSLVAENRTICSPASIQSVPSNGDNQDVVSMGLISARNAKRILDNNNYILAVEYLAGAQAVDISGCYNSLSKAAKVTYNKVRSIVSTLEYDRYMSDDIELVADLLSNGELLDSIEEIGISLV